MYLHDMSPAQVKAQGYRYAQFMKHPVRPAPYCVGMYPEQCDKGLQQLLRESKRGRFALLDLSTSPPTRLYEPDWIKLWTSEAPTVTHQKP